MTSNSDSIPMMKHIARVLLAFTYQNDRLRQKVEHLSKEWGSNICLPCDVTKDEDINNVFSIVVVIFYETCFYALF